MDEPNFLLRWAMYHFAGGDAYLLGLLVFAVVQILLCQTQVLWRRRWLIIASRTSLIWAVVDPSPIPWVVLALWALIVLTTVVRRRKKAGADDPHDGSRAEKLFRLPLAGLALVAIGCELPHYCGPQFPTAETSIAVAGDSVTAGLNDGEETWTKQMSQSSKLHVFDASQPGATLKSAIHQVELLNGEQTDILILEIGGNDLLEGLPVDTFEHDLRQLLMASQKPSRAIVMFELPLPPLAMRYCAVQRRLAAEHQVQLIPRRHFLQVLTSTGGTVDGIHLSKRGQTRLMELVQNLLKIDGQTAGASGDYRHLEPKTPYRR